MAGPGGHPSGRRSRRLRARGRSAQNGLEPLEGALFLAASRIRVAQDIARRAEALAAIHGGVVTPDGAVIELTPTAYPLAPLGVDATASGPTWSRDVAALVQRAVAAADHADATVAASWSSAVEQTGWTGGPLRPRAAWTVAGATVDAGISTMPLVAMAARQRAVPEHPGDAPAGSGSATMTRWQGLDADGRSAAIARHPDLVGAADGLPAWARDRANRLVLARAEQDLTLQAEALRTSGPSREWFRRPSAVPFAVETAGAEGNPVARAAYLAVLSRLAAVRSTRTVLDRSDGQSRQLLVFDLGGPSARVAIAVADLDRAQHVAVVVPGFTTTVSRDLVGADGLASELSALARRESMAWGDRGEVAVVTWLGYDAPQWSDTVGAESVVLPQSAREGATLLNPFLRGLPVGAHLTLVGHSYGSTTAGLAVAAGASGVDDLVVLGSPGLGVATTAALGLPGPRVHVFEAKDDPVADLGWFGRDPGHLSGVDRPLTGAVTLPDGSAGTEAAGHSRYLAAGTTSQWNVASVVAWIPAVAGPPRPASW